MFMDLVRADARLKFQSDHERLMLNTAAERGYTDIVRVLRAMGASVFERGSFKNTCLHLAAEKGHLDVVIELLS